MLNLLRLIWGQLTERRQITLAISASIIVLGVVLIALGEINELGWTRIIGAGLISLAATVLGLMIGAADPLGPTIASIISDRRKLIVTALTLLIVGPLIVGMIVAAGGLIISGRDAEWHLLLLGILITFALLVLTVVTVWVALSLVMQSGKRDTAQHDHEVNGRGEP